MKKSIIDLCVQVGCASALCAMYITNVMYNGFDVRVIPFLIGVSIICCDGIIKAVRRVKSIS